LLAIVAMLAAGAATFATGVEISGEFLRPRIERAPSAQAQGARVGELLAGATVSGAFDRGQLILPASGSHPASAIDFSAALDAAPGKPTRLAVHGAAGGEPVRLTLDAGAVADLSRTGERLPLTLRASSGDLRLEARRKIALDGNGEARVQREGRRLERLGTLLGMTLPAAEPYSVHGHLRVAAGAIHDDALDIAIGRSRFAGSIQLGRAAAGRKSHRASLRATAPHLEDVGGDRLLRFGDDAPLEEQAGNQNVARASAWLLDILSSADFDLAFEVDLLHGAGQRLAAGRLTAQAAAGN